MSGARETNGNGNYTIKDFLRSIDDRLSRMEGKLESKADQTLVANVEQRLRELELKGSASAREAIAVLTHRIEKVETRQADWPESRTKPILDDFAAMKKQVARVWFIVGACIIAAVIAFGKAAGLIPWIL